MLRFLSCSALVLSLSLSDAFVLPTSVLGRSVAAPTLRAESARQCSVRMSGSEMPDLKLSRREAILAASAAALVPAQKALAEGAPVATPGYVDQERGFSFTPPSGWEKGTAQFPGADRNPARPEIISFVSPENKDVNLAVVSYSIRPDYTKLGSLGTIDDVARTILGTSGNLDAEMFTQKEKGLGNGPGYIFDYRIKDKHLLTVFTTQSGEYAGTWLVTLTLQAPLGDYDKVKSTLESALTSFALTKR